MKTGGRTLEKQVRGEIRLRAYVFNTLVILSLLYVTGTMVFSDMGLLHYIEMRQKQVELEQELSLIEENNHRLRQQISQYQKDSFFMEKHAREEFGMAGKDELIFIYKD